MRFSYTQPISTFLPDLGYSSFPILTFLSTQTYESICGPNSGKEPISVTKSDFSYTSQADADSQAMASAMALAILQRDQDPCVPSTLPPSFVEESDGPETLPEVDAGDDQFVGLDQAATLAGDVSNASSYFWIQISGDPCVIDDPTSLTTAVTTPGIGEYVFRLTGINDFGEDFDEMTMSVALVVMEWDLQKIVNGVTTIIRSGTIPEDDSGSYDIDSTQALLPAPDPVYVFFQYIFHLTNYSDASQTVYFKIFGDTTCQFIGDGNTFSAAIQIYCESPIQVVEQQATTNSTGVTFNVVNGNFPPDVVASKVVPVGASQFTLNSVLINDLQGCTPPLSATVTRNSTHRLAFEYLETTPP